MNFISILSVVQEKLSFFRHLGVFFFHIKLKKETRVRKKTGRKERKGESSIFSIRRFWGESKVCGQQTRRHKNPPFLPLMPRATFHTLDASFGESNSKEALCGRQKVSSSRSYLSTFRDD